MPVTLQPRPTHRVTFRYNAFVRALPIALVAAGVTALVASLSAQEPEPKPSFDTWLAATRSQALERGISEATVSAALDGLEPLPVVVERDRSQAEVVLSVDDYVRRRLTPKFVKSANEHAAAERATLKKV